MCAICAVFLYPSKCKYHTTLIYHKAAQRLFIALDKLPIKSTDLSGLSNLKICQSSWGVQILQAVVIAYLLFNLI